MQKTPTVAHSWASDTMSLGDMAVVGFGGGPLNEISYQMEIMLKRKHGRYWFDFTIRAMQVEGVSACFENSCVCFE